MIPIGIAIGLVAVFFGMSQALEMIVNARRNEAMTCVLEEQ